ncbi:unnamed protein product [Blepharisma stoltei]|uniref:Uncharacterized protein n=1 Tax=Blepharisma stoltei TaxID=1481888 RepID=A0AAU9JM31_9CILI|nr:unnamed protein product [Blepharisma stoltei]
MKFQLFWICIIWYEFRFEKRKDCIFGQIRPKFIFKLYQLVFLPGISFDSPPLQAIYKSHLWFGLSYFFLSFLALAAINRPSYKNKSQSEYFYLNFLLSKLRFRILLFSKVFNYHIYPSIAYKMALDTYKIEKLKENN